MKQWLLVTGCLLLLINTNGQSVNLPFSTTYIDISAYNKEADVLSSTSNQAALAKIRLPAAGIYCERLYMLSELDLYTFAFAAPLKKGVLGLSCRFAGSGGAQYLQGGIAFGKQLSANLDLGIRLNVTRQGISGYGHLQMVSAEAGAIIHLTDQLVTGIHISNVGAGSFSKKPDKGPPVKCTMGFGYETSGNLLIKFDVIKEEDQPPGLTPGIQYNIKKQVFLRAGILSSTGTFIAGTGLKWRSMRTDLSLSWHAQLGFTPALLIIIQPGNH